ncbi:hypothetical protein GUJ93_ZPchr0012g20488 [Zizania palustris]|uniref:Uncharacterized protein n=1 Tax=Zizania palustris TaxID=103762 RepID=A0A8J5WQJ0_ZIZPA|nr:hypothetical protein GUJ93_ZPchr0012g20488 [Zizania palustris]
MDSYRDGGDVDREEVHEMGAGGGESSEEYASSAQSDNKGECEEASAGEHASSLVGNGGSGCEEATSPAVVNSDSGGGAVLATAKVDDVEGVSHEDEGENEEDGYVTPTSPRHRLQAPEVCPPVPWPRRLLMSPVSTTPVAGSTRGRKRIRAERDNLWRETSLPVARRLLFTDVDTDELLSVFVERQQRRRGGPRVTTSRSQQ